MDDPEPWVLGIGASHNGAVCLLRGHEIMIAIQEERLTRIKRDRIRGAAPSHAIDCCLRYAGLHPSELTAVVMCGQNYVTAPRNDIRLNPQLQVGLNDIAVTTIGHHLGHGVSTFALSGFDDAAILVVDGLGSPSVDLSDAERTAVLDRVTDGWESASIYHGSGIHVQPVEKHMVRSGMLLAPDTGEPKRADEAPDCAPGMPRFGTIGGMYAAVARQIFGDPLDGSGKVMGLAPFGHPTLDPRHFFDIADGRFVFSDVVPAMFPHNDRWPAHADEYRDLAASVQLALQEAMVELAMRARELTGSRRLCMAGGVALNGIANQLIIEQAGFDEVFIVPAAEDSGTALGAAFWGAWQCTRVNHRVRLRRDATGPEYSVGSINEAIEKTPGIVVHETADVVESTVQLLLSQQIVGWFQGGSELGPRALGQRSILCDARRSAAAAILNERVKHRESFRPFAPIVLAEHAPDWFDFGNTSTESPFMMRVVRFRSDRQHLVPAVVHVDGTGRLQTVSADSDPRLHSLLTAFHQATGVPLLLNTSFNVAGEPIVEDPSDALWCLLSSGLDYCVLGDRLVSRRDGTSSPLDFYLRLTATQVIIQTPCKPTLATLSVAILPGPVGMDVQVPIDAAEMAVLRLVNGMRTGWDILELIGGDASLAERELRLTHQICRLRRLRAISVHDKPEADSVLAALPVSQ
jgi:carbamoyltransferase